MKKILLDNNLWLRFVITTSLWFVRNYPADYFDRIAQIQETGYPFLKKADVLIMKSESIQQNSQEGSGAEG